MEKYYCPQCNKEVFSDIGIAAVQTLEIKCPFCGNVFPNTWDNTMDWSKDWIDDEDDEGWVD